MSDSILRRPLLLVSLLLLLLPAPATGATLMTRYDLDSGVGETVLPNGLTVLTLERHAAPVVAVQIWYRVGSADEPLGATGMAHFLEHLMFKGTDRYGRGEIDRITLKLGGSNNAGTWKDWTQYYFNLASDRWETALEIEANRMSNLTLDLSEFEAERKVVLEELMTGRDSPWGELDETIESIAFSAHPYRHPVIGWRSDVERVTRETVRAFYERFYTPRNATLVLVGDFDTREALERVVRHFGPLPAGPEPVARKLTEPTQNGERRIVVRRDAELSRLEVVYHSGRSGDRDEAVREVIEGLLVGNSRARLRKRLVEDDSAVTFVSAANDARMDPGLFWIWTELRPGADRAGVEAAIHEETSRLARETVSADELARAKKKLLSDLVFRHATAERAAEDLGQFACEADWRDVGRAPARIRSVTAEDVRRVAAVLFAKTNRTVGWALPRENGPGGGKPPRKKGRSRPRRGAPAGGVAVRLSPKVVRLPNGLTLLVARNTTVPVTTLSVRVDGGRLRETKPGLAHLTGEYLLKGAGERDADALAFDLAALGAEVTAGDTGLAARCLTEDAAGTIGIVSDLLTRATFPEAEFSKLRDRTLSQIRAERDDPEDLVLREFHRLVFRGHPYENPSRGTEKSVAALTRQDVVAHYRRHFVPGNTVIAAVSDRPLEELAARLEKTFGAWSGDTPSHPPLPELVPGREEVRRVVERDIDQVQIAMGHLGVRRDHPDWYALLVMDYVLGMGPGFTDRLSRTLRDRDGLAYAVSSSIAGSAGREPGRFLAYIATSASQRDRAIEGIRLEIERIRREPVAPEELADAKAYLTGSFVFGYETAEQLAARLADLHRLGLGFDYPAKFADRIAAVTADDILRVAKKHLRPEAMTTVVVGPVKHR